MGRSIEDIRKDYPYSLLLYKTNNYLIDINTGSISEAYKENILSKITPYIRYLESCGDLVKNSDYMVITRFAVSRDSEEDYLKVELYIKDYEEIQSFLMNFPEVNSLTKEDRCQN